MKLLLRISLALGFLGLGGTLLALQRNALQGFGQGFGGQGQTYEVDDNPNEKAEFYWSRLHYNDNSNSGAGFGRFGGGTWSTDYPKADRQFLLAFKRLTRINAKSTEQVVDLDHDEVFEYPFLYAVRVQNWTFTADEAKRMHDYLLKGGFLMVDDFHGEADWESFLQGMRQVFPDRPIEDLKDDDEIFHILYDLGQRFQVPGEQYVSTHRTYEKDGFIPEWRGIRDDDGRIMVAICFNMHLGDAWEWADDPRYPERFASMAFRLGINYIVYSMTH